MNNKPGIGIVVVAIVAMAIFAGCVEKEDKLIQLTWQSRLGFIYDKESFVLLREFTYPTEGWGISHDGKRLIMSDGTSMLYFLNSDTFEEIERIEVHDKGVPITNLNELEFAYDAKHDRLFITGKYWAKLFEIELSPFRLEEELPEDIR